MDYLDKAMDGYLEAVLWAEVGETWNPDSPLYDFSWLDLGFTVEDVDAQSVISQREQLDLFITRAQESCLFKPDVDWHQVGADFYFTRQHHGTGFWDRPEVYGPVRCEALADLVERCFNEIYTWLDGDCIVIEGETREE